MYSCKVQNRMCTCMMYSCKTSACMSAYRMYACKIPYPLPTCHPAPPLPAAPAPSILNIALLTGYELLYVADKIRKDISQVSDVYMDLGPHASHRRKSTRHAQTFTSLGNTQ